VHPPRPTAADPLAEMERTFTAERAAHARAVAAAAGRMVAPTTDKIEYAGPAGGRGSPLRTS
jgi:hypothetical protein